jgi:hypothetical protein
MGTSYSYGKQAVFALTHLPGTSKTGFRHVKIMKEFVWINIFYILLSGK